MQYFISFLEGIITFVSPCLLPMLPIYISYFAGDSERDTKRVVKNALGFILGFTLVFVLLMLSKLAAGGWAGDLCSALVWPGLLAIEYGHGRPIQRPLQLVCISEALRLLFWLLTKYAGMSALAFWTNIMFVLLACARGWAALVLYKTQEETL